MLTLSTFWSGESLLPFRSGDDSADVFDPERAEVDRERERPDRIEDVELRERERERRLPLEDAVRERERRLGGITSAIGIPWIRNRLILDRNQ